MNIKVGTAPDSWGVWFPSDPKQTPWQRLVDTTHRVANIVHDQFGLILVFHPEPDTHVEYEEQIETLLEQTDPNRVSLCLDTGHHAYRGGDPVSFMLRHHERIRCLHL